MKTQWFSRVLIGFVSVLSLGIFCWPILVGDAAGAHAGLAQTIFMVLMPVLVAIVLIEFSTGGIDSRQIALLGVLIALNSVVRMLGAGTAGIETAFFLILIGAYAVSYTHLRAHETG
jgi:energy-coupling factor transport system substrate-specific component